MNRRDGDTATLDLDRQRSGLLSTGKKGNISVLVVDDDRNILEMLSMALGRHGLKVTKTRSAIEALGCLERKKFKFVITDFQMPGMDGLVLASTVKMLYPSTFIILITGVKRETLERKQGVENIDLFIQKPFKIRTLLNAIEEFVGGG